MNILIVSEKSDVKLYEQIINSAPNTSVLGAETTIKSDFIKKLKEKWHPHIVIIDTSVPIKNSDCKELVSQIKDNYPYIKIIVMTDKEDDIDYNSDFIIKGQVSNIEFIELLDKARESITHNTNIAETILNDDIGITEELNIGNGITEDLSKKVFQLPKAKTKTKIKTPKTKSKRKNNTYLYAITGIAIVLFILIVTLVFKACSATPTKNNVSTSDEVMQVIDSTPVAESEITVSFTDAPTTPTIESQEIVSNTISESPTVKTTKPTEKETKNNNKLVDQNSSESSKTTSDNSLNKNNTNDRTNSPTKKPESSNNNSINKIIAVNSVQISCSSKTLIVGNTLSLIATVSPSNATNKKVTWYSSNSTVATVNNGIVTAKSSGSTIITAKAGDKYASCSITVKSNTTTVKPTQKPTTKPTQKPTAQPTTKDPISLSTTSHNIVVGQIINIYLNNSDGCSWSISSPSVVQICGGGSNKITLKGKKSGNTTVVATDTKTGKSYTCYVNVN